MRQMKLEEMEQPQQRQLRNLAEWDLRQTGKLEQAKELWQCMVPVERIATVLDVSVKLLRAYFGGVNEPL